MKRRTISKRVSKNKRSLHKRPLKRTNKKSKTKRRTKRRTSKKIEQKGGGDITLILDILLSKDIISFMPTSQVFDYEKMSRYMNMIDIHTLKDIVLENSYWRKSPTIQKIFNYTSEELKDPKKIKFDVENINCENLINDRNNNLKKLFLFLFECNKDIFVKENVDWFKVVLGIETFDETFEYQVMKSIIEMGLFMKKEDIMEHIKLLENNMDFKLIVKKRLYSCAEKPRSFFERIFSSKPSFPSFKDCENTGGVLHLYDEYKRFLTKKSEDGLSKLDKVKILIFCETRQHLLSKYVGLEMIRLNDKKYSEIRHILKTIYKLDKDIIKENDEKLKKITLEQDSKRDIKKNLDKIDSGNDEGEVNKELTEEEKIIQELEAQRIKSKSEGTNFLNEEKRINDKINSSGEQTGGALNLDTPDIATPVLDTPVLDTPNPFIDTPVLDTPVLDTPNPVLDKPLIDELVIDKPLIDASSVIDTPSEIDTSEIDTSILDTIDLDDEIPIKAEAGVTDNLTTSIESDISLKTKAIEVDTEEEEEEEESKEDKARKEAESYELYNKCKKTQQRYKMNNTVDAKDVNEGLIDDCEKKLKIDVFASTTSPDM